MIETQKKPAPRPLPNLGTAPPEANYPYPRKFEPTAVEVLTAQLADTRAALAAETARCLVAEARVASLEGEVELVGQKLGEAIAELQRVNGPARYAAPPPGHYQPPPWLGLLDAYCDGAPRSEERADAWAKLSPHLTEQEREGAHIPSTEVWRLAVRARALGDVRRELGRRDGAREEMTMGSCWDLICNAADLVRWMTRNGFGPERYSPPAEWTYPILIGDPGGESPSWMIVDVSDARRLVIAAGQVVSEDHDT